LLGSPATDSPWCKIAPPAGEFRWVFSKFVDSELPADLARDEREAAGESDLDEDEPQPRDGVRLASGMQKTAREPRIATRQAPRVDIANESGRQRELDRIDLELSAMVVEEITTWSFQPLNERANALLEQTGRTERAPLIDIVKVGTSDGFDPKMRALLHVSRTVRGDARELTAADVAAARSAGATDADVQLAVLIAAAF
jgi:hypothetical protein